MHFQISGNYSSLGSGLLTNQNNYAKMKAINDNIIEMYAIAEERLSRITLLLISDEWQQNEMKLKETNRARPNSEART